LGTSVPSALLLSVQEGVAIIVESLLIWLILRKLSIPRAFFAALIFAVHPANVAAGYRLVVAPWGELWYVGL